MYSKDNCHFCLRKLRNNSSSIFLRVKNKKSAFESKACNRHGCEFNYNILYKIEEPNNWVVSFVINEYNFKIIDMEQADGSRTIETEVLDLDNDQYFAVPEVRLITLENYIRELEYIKKMDLFR